MEGFGRFRRCGAYNGRTYLPQASRRVQRMNLPVTSAALYIVNGIWQKSTLEESGSDTSAVNNIQEEERNGS